MLKTTPDAESTDRLMNISKTNNILREEYCVKSYILSFL